MHEYKVVSIKDRTMFHKADTQSMTEALNRAARHGWRLVGVCSTDLVSAATGGGRNETLFVLEREAAELPEPERDASGRAVFAAGHDPWS